MGCVIITHKSLLHNIRGGFMKHFLTLLLVFCVTFTFAGEFKLENSNRGEVVITWKIDQYTITPYKDNYVLVNFPGGCGTFGDGKPQLPSQQIFVELPKGAKANIEVTVSSEEYIKLQKDVYPTQTCPNDTIGEQSRKKAFVKDRSTYASDKLFPGKIVQIVRYGIMRGRNIALLRVNPVQYRAKTKELTIYKELKIKLNYNAKLAIQEKDDVMDVIAQNMVLNYTPGKAKLHRGIDYLIITHDDYISVVNELAKWEMEKGYNTKVVKLSDITTLSAPSPSAIKAAIKKVYPSVKYVLLIGDSDQIPLPTSAKSKSLGGDPELYANQTPSDLCYALLEGADYYPDVYIGRIPANNLEEAEVMIDKILFYERTPDMGDWYKRFLLCGEFQYQYSQKNRAERLFCETAYVITKNLKGLYHFPEQTIGTGSSGLGHAEYFFRKETYRHKIKDEKGMNCKMPRTWAKNIVADSKAKANVLSFWKDGAFLVQHRDHGSNTSWGKPGLSKADVMNLNNGNKLPVLFSINCLTGSIDYSSDCFVEAALKNPNGGAVASLAASRVSYSWWNDTLCDGFYTCLFGSDIYDSMRDKANPAPGVPARSAELGIILNYGKMYLTVNYPDNPWNSDREEIEFYLFHCFGTPDMMIRTKPPQKVVPQFPKNIGENFTLTVRNNARKAIAGAQVCFYQSGILFVGKTDKDGNITVQMPRSAKGKIKVTITGHNLYPFRGYIEK